MTLRTVSEIITQLKWARAYWYQNYTRKEQNYIIDLVWQLESESNRPDDFVIDYPRIDRLLNRAEYWQQHQDFIPGRCPMDQTDDRSIQLNQCGKNNARI
jgi:hypothetical protein